MSGHWHSGWQERIWMEEGLSLSYTNGSDLTQVSYPWSPDLIFFNTGFMPGGATLSSLSLELCSSVRLQGSWKLFCFYCLAPACRWVLGLEQGLSKGMNAAWRQWRGKWAGRAQEQQLCQSELCLFLRDFCRQMPPQPPLGSTLSWPYLCS